MIDSLHRILIAFVHRPYNSSGLTREPNIHVNCFVILRDQYLLAKYPDPIKLSTGTNRCVTD